MLDARWAIGEQGEFYISASLADTDAEFDELMMVFAPDAVANGAADLFTSGLPGEGADTGPLVDHDVEGLHEIHDYTNLEYRELRTTVGFDYQLSESVGLFASVSLFDLDDDEPYYENTAGLPVWDATGEVVLVSGGLTWSF